MRDAAVGDDDDDDSTSAQSTHSAENVHEMGSTSRLLHTAIQLLSRDERTWTTVAEGKPAKVR